MFVVVTQVQKMFVVVTQVQKMFVVVTIPLWQTVRKLLSKPNITDSFDNSLTGQS